MSMLSDGRFPIKGGLSVSIKAAERAYFVFAKSYPNVQSMDNIASDGGFGILDFCMLYSGNDLSDKDLADLGMLKDQLSIGQVLADAELEVAR